MKSQRVTIQMKAIEHCFSVVLFITAYKVVLTNKFTKFVKFRTLVLLKKTRKISRALKTFLARKAVCMNAEIQLSLILKASNETLS